MRSKLMPTQNHVKYSIRYLFLVKPSKKEREQGMCFFILHVCEKKKKVSCAFLARGLGDSFSTCPII